MERNSRFAWKFKTMKSIHDMQFWVFCFPNRRYALKGAGRIKLQSMAIVEKKFLPYISLIPEAQNYRELYGNKKAIFRNSKE